MTKPTLFILQILLLLTVNPVKGRSITNSRNHNLVSDEIIMELTINQSQLVLNLDNLKATNVTCEPTYGFLPCTTVVWGQLFLLVVYEFLLSLSDKYISRGSDLFFEMFGTGIFGASFSQILGMFPQIAVVLVSGIAGSDETVQNVSSMSMGMLAGSAILSLTIVWGSIVASGSYNLSGNPSKGGLKDLFSLNGYGVTTDSETKATGRVMLLSVIPLLLLQLAKVFNSASATRVLVLITLIISIIMLLIYCTYQVFQPWIQSRRLTYLINRSRPANFLRTLYNSNGKPDEATISELFKKIDWNSNAKISAAELRALFLGMQVEKTGLAVEDFASEALEVFDGVAEISESDFIQGLSKWLSGSSPYAGRGRQRTEKKPSGSSRTSSSNGSAAELQTLVDQVQKAKDAEDPVWWNYTKAGFLITLGTGIAIALAQPLMQTVSSFSTAIGIPSFFTSYVVIPVALTFRQGGTAISSAKAKTEQAVSLAFSEIYGGVFMNNVLGLASYLFLVYLRDLSWDVSAEILVVLVICCFAGVTTSFVSRFPAWASIVAYALYPISLAFLYVLTSVLGWG